MKERYQVELKTAVILTPLILEETTKLVLQGDGVGGEPWYGKTDRCQMRHREKMAMIGWMFRMPKSHPYLDELSYAETLRHCGYFRSTTAWLSSVFHNIYMCPVSTLPHETGNIR